MGPLGRGIIGIQQEGAPCGSQGGFLEEMGLSKVPKDGRGSGQLADWGLV